jgi:hypothetical protein
MHHEPTGPMPISGSAGPELCTVGDIAVTQTTVITPNGQAPLAGTNWIVTNQTTTSQGIPAWAIVLAIILAFACFVGLFFLLVKEERTTGFIQVSVQGDGLYHATQIPISSPQAAADVYNRVNYIRGLVAQAG